MMEMKTILTISEGLDFPVSIAQSGKRNFVVTYGKQISTFDNWKSAFEDFGYCVAHSLECAGNLIR
jgi:hypothetical protein